MPLSDRLENFVMIHEPETAFDPAGPAATFLLVNEPVTGAAFVLLLSLNSTAAVSMLVYRGRRGVDHHTVRPTTPCAG